MTGGAASGDGGSGAASGGVAASGGGRRTLPVTTPRSEAFWHGGAEGRLLITRCQACGLFLHPPRPLCPRCHSADVVPEPVSGHGTVYSYTVNRYTWLPDFPAPYVVAEVEIDEQPGLLILTNLVGCAPEQVTIGMAVEVSFEHQGEVWLPVFGPAGEGRAGSTPERSPGGSPSGAPRPSGTAPGREAGPTKRPTEHPAKHLAEHPTGAARTTPKPEALAAIRGVGTSQIGRRLLRDPLELTAEAALAAIADAGLQPSDIDGVSTYPGAGYSSAGMSGAGVWDVTELLGLRTRWSAGGPEVAGQLGSVVNAVLAVASGLCEHVLCFRTVHESSAQALAGSRAAALTGTGSASPMQAAGAKEWTLPYGALHTTFGGLETQRYLHETGGDRRQLAQVALTARRHAAGNPDAVYRAPLSLDDYLSARMISDPLCLYDCDVPVDGSIALIVSRRDAGAGPSPLVGVEAMGSAPGMQAAAEMLWSRTDLTPADVDVAELYDGFSVLALQWMEALRLCEPGGGAAFVDGGERVALDGQLPLNTGGGQLSAGRLHGYGFVLEACTQLRGEGGDRQVAPWPTVAAVSNGAGLFTGCLLLTAP